MAQITLNSTGVASNGTLALQSNGTTTAVTIDASQNVGIGTASPSYKLQIFAASNPEMRLGDATVTYQLYTEGATAAVMGTTTNHALVYRTNATERMRIDSSGNLLVGTTSAISGSKFNLVQGTARGIASNTTDSTTHFHVVYSNPNGDVGNISTNASATTYATSSDYRLKESIAPMTGALAKVALLKPCTYKWKVDGSDGQGFIAHELDEVVPGCVTGEKDAVDANGNPQYQGIDTSFLVATLTAAIQELKAIVDAQAARITALESN